MPGGFGLRGCEGKIVAAQYAREKDIPYFGICLGMQGAVIEFARNVCGLKKASSTELDENSPEPVIILQPNQKDIDKKGGTMRLGDYPCRIKAKTRAFEAYGKDLVLERHRHRYEVNNKFLKEFKRNGLVASGICPKNNLVEIVEIPEHIWYVGCQFHPELISRPLSPHPLFVKFIEKSIQRREK